MTTDTAIIPLAGHGTRMLPASRAMPKFLLPVYDRPALAHILRESRLAGIKKFVFVISPGQKQLIQSYFNHDEKLKTRLLASGKTDLWNSCNNDMLPPDSMLFSLQQQPLGLGHAILCAQQHLRENSFAILLPDVLIRSQIPCLAQMIQAYNKTNSNIVAVEKILPEHASSYGIVQPSKNSSLHEKLIPLSNMIEKPRSNPPSCLKLTGRYILHPDIFPLLDKQQKDHTGEIQLTGAIAALIQKQPCHALQYNGQSYDCGSFAGYCEANAAYGLDDPKNNTAIRNSLQKLLSQP